MKKISKLLNDIINLFQILAFRDFLKYIFYIIKNIPEIIKSGNMGSVDIQYGNTVKIPTKKNTLIVQGQSILGQIREIWARKVYAQGNFFDHIADGCTVVDMGANVGTFTLYALSNLNVARLISIEPNAELNEQFKQNIRLNFPNANVTLLSAFVGDFSEKQERMVLDSVYNNAEMMTIDKLINNYSIKQIDFLKCDIEGGEYSILNKDSKLLQITKKLAVEIHDFAGKRNELIDLIKSSGFKVRHYIDNPNDCIILAEKA